MADQTMEETSKARIISHMNAQHQSSLTRYLEHFQNMSSFAARSPRLVDITTQTMRIHAPYLLSDRRYTISISPPLENLSGARTRFVEMDQQASTALGRARETVTRYKAPNTPYQTAVMFGVLLGLFSFSRAANFLPESWLTTTILAPVPWLARIFYQYQPLGLGLIILIHVVECIQLARILLKYNVPIGSRIWWVWIVSTFFEGFGAFMRLDEVIQDERKKEEAKQH